MSTPLRCCSHLPVCQSAALDFPGAALLLPCAGWEGGEDSGTVLLQKVPGLGELHRAVPRSQQNWEGEL